MSIERKIEAFSRSGTVSRSATVITLRQSLKGKSYDVKLTVSFDAQKAAEALGRKAIENKSRRSKALYGAVIAHVFEIQEVIV